MLRIFEHAIHRAKIAGLVGAVVVVGSGCANISGSLPDALPTPSRDELRAGSAKLDITPPPGFPMGGHSIAGQISRGYWVRLQVRSIFLESPNGEKIALVSADLWSFPAGLGDRIAEIISNSGSPRCQLRRDQLVLAATHTHQSPGNFSSSSLYNFFASKEPGFDLELFEFLARRIADAVKSSCESSIPALIRFNQAQIGELARNRSVDAFLRNPEANSILLQNERLPEGVTTAPFPDVRAFRAIYPFLQTLWFLDARDTSSVIGVAAFVAVHPTAMNHDAQFYSSDLFGVASIYAEEKLVSKVASGKSVVAIFNGAEGDVSPIWYSQDRLDTLRLGELVGRQIVKQIDAAESIVGEINHQFEVKSLSNECFVEADGNMRCTTSRPNGGPAALGGAEDGRTWLYDWGCKEGVSLLERSGSRLSDRRSQAPSFPCRLAYWVADIGMQLFAGPSTVPIGVYQIGQVALVTLPGEFTTVMGYRIREQVKNRMGSSNKEVVLVGLTNEYVSYFTTPEEFVAQEYEGASTLYGAYSASLIMTFAGDLAAKLKPGTSPTGRASDFNYSAGFYRTFSPSNVSDDDRHLLERGIRDVMFRAQESDMRLQRFCWNSSAPDLGEARENHWSTTPTVSIETLASNGMWETLRRNGFPVDDYGVDFVTALAKWDGPRSEWCTFWILDSESTKSGRKLRISVKTPDGRQISSDPF